MRNLCKNLFEVGDIMKLANKIGAHRKGGGCSADIYIYLSTISMKFENNQNIRPSFTL